MKKIEDQNNLVLFDYLNLDTENIYKGNENMYDMWYVENINIYLLKDLILIIL